MKYYFLKNTLLILAISFFVLGCEDEDSDDDGKKATEETKIDGEWIQNPATTHYYVVTKPMNWKVAKQTAEDEGGYILVINNQEENEWIINTFGDHANTRGYNAFHIGLTDEDQEGQFVWINGDELTYTNWDTGQPDNDVGDGSPENFAQIMGNNSALPSGTWNDINDTELYPAIIEIESNPTK